jgi:50S ribosomal protein L16 3-hydroxylase
MIAEKFCRHAGGDCGSPAYNPPMLDPLLGGLSPRQFLARHWQKRALLVRGALPGFTGFLDRDGLFALASRDDVESRLVRREGRLWRLEHGPFRPRDLRTLPPRNWTLLVQGVNLHHTAGAALLARFDFVPHARLDDLMVSYAVPGGGVGPHFDSYDVFLLQGAGRRRWQVSEQADLELDPRAPLRILRRFRPQDGWVLAPGDLLYLPPRIAHHGVAMDACTTWSVGFRAPGNRELASQFLGDLADRLDFEGLYADPGLAPARHPGRIGTDMLDATVALLARIRWTRADVEDFLGRYLSEPKADVFFDPPAERLAPAHFAAGLAHRGAVLDLRTRMLYGRRALYVNGETCRFPRGVPDALRQLADRRRLPPGRQAPALARLMHDWHGNGFLHLVAVDSMEIGIP